MHFFSQNICTYQKLYVLLPPICKNKHLTIKKIKIMKEIYFVMTWVNKKPHGVSKYAFTTKKLAKAHAEELCKQVENMIYEINPLTIIA